MEEFQSCCSSPRWESAAIDCIFTEFDLRLRHIPGMVCMNCRSCHAPDVSASPELMDTVANCLNYNPYNLTILKAVPRISDQENKHSKYGMEPAFLDVGLGYNAGLVVEKIKGFWNWQTSEAVLPDEGSELRGRLMHLGGNLKGRLIPSLIYDTPSHPRSVQIEITTRCNLACSYCTHRNLPVKADIQMDKLNMLLDRIDFSRVENVDFTGLGEPVLHPQLADIVREIRKRGNPKDIRVVTNGTALTPSRFKALCQAGITSLAFSIDSLDPERFARSRGGAKLKKVMDNLEALVAYRKEESLDNLQIKIKAVLIDNPYEDADALLTESARLGISMPHFSCLDTRNVVQDHYDEPWLEDNWSSGGSEAFTLWTEARWRELSGWSMNESGPVSASEHEKAIGFMNPILKPPPELCRWAVDATFISATGDMLSCCEQMIDLPRNHQGSLLDKDMESLWQEDLLWNYRLPLSIGLVPKGCDGCNWAPSEGKSMEEMVNPSSIQ